MKRVSTEKERSQPASRGLELGQSWGSKQASHVTNRQSKESISKYKDPTVYKVGTSMDKPKASSLSQT